ncbi:hypothetical protein [Levilactobacillus suantsaii]|uniref:Uncharacterized protein n=1 Tax=Levilactobacillus suantsaii TaxID=2292255 RepID=A0A4Q0VI17_9LACO|nr:hypothetical protein [Levilactobacillus suantsaii]QMU08896.1 hypothetical protein H3M12_04405 [Levilactobacillus suantsaii]RXI76155.1 hypothetical protein DXH47_10870 [Levilactobacillus suantsaii]
MSGKRYEFKEGLYNQFHSFIVEYITNSFSQKFTITLAVIVTGLAAIFLSSTHRILVSVLEAATVCLIMASIINLVKEEWWGKQGIELSKQHKGLSPLIISSMVEHKGYSAVVDDIRTGRIASEQDAFQRIVEGFDVVDVVNSNVNSGRVNLLVSYIQDYCEECVKQDGAENPIVTFLLSLDNHQVWQIGKYVYRHYYVHNISRQLTVTREMPNGNFSVLIVVLAEEMTKCLDADAVKRINWFNRLKLSPQQKELLRKAE